ncbi:MULTISPECIES: transmembrane 220 family protein [Rhodomicrobium]|uniref:transmembrane 220 family protein n=1 Tax=Rhodomicrobium TaxID=1068 RepID=UPI000B4C1A9D|nr:MULTISPECIES: transmembrane 220 family protein [Rhodomicrobium]
MTRVLWRILMGVLCICFVLFAAVQYNDPDPEVWATIYSIGAIWTGLAAFAPRLLWTPAASWLLLASMVLALAGVVYYWPHAAHWWREEVWWQDEESREGMGMMILAAGIVLVGAHRFISRPA